MMMLLNALVNSRPPQECHIYGVGVTYKFIKQSAVPQFQLSIILRANIYDTSYDSYALQNNHIKIHMFGITLPTLYVIKLCC